VVLQTPLHKASFEGHEAVVNLLLDRGSSAAVLDHEGLTPLHHAAAGGRHAVVDRLCQDPLLDVTQESKDGEDAAILASKNGFKELASKLTRHGYIKMCRDNLRGQMLKRCVIREAFDAPVATSRLDGAGSPSSAPL